jgi:4-diphosphocytidyl-2-C-methyl-D-erythritol kinase
MVTVFQRVALSDRIAVERSLALNVSGFPGDTLVRRALEFMTEGDGVSFAARIQKRLPVAAGLGGGSSDAATALRLANALRPDPYPAERLRAFARTLGADVPYFLEDGPQLGTGDGADLEPLDLPQDYWVLLVLPHRVKKISTEEVYAAFDARGGESGYEERRASLFSGLNGVDRARDLATLPPNDLASSPLARELVALGAFRADVSGAGPIVYGLFLHRHVAREAQRRISPEGRTWLTTPAWYR